MRIAIVGAGPAGAMAAVRLARAGASVDLFDPSHPREKPCGGGLTGRALALVADTIDLGALAAVVVQAAIVEAPATVRLKADTTGTSHETSVVSAFRRTVESVPVNLRDKGLTPASSVVVASRAVFDAALVAAAVRAGARLVPEKVIGVARRGRLNVVHTTRREYVADFLIGADGANSLVRKTYAQPFGRMDLSIAAGHFVHGATAPTMTIACMTGQPGYLWSFPRPDHLAVGVCAPASSGGRSRDLLSQSRAWIEARGLPRPTRLEPYAWPIPSVGLRPRDARCASGPGWMLLGDAAGLVDPLTREGIYYALLSGGWAAGALMATQPEAAYQGRLEDEIYPELDRAARLSGLFFSAPFARLFVAALRTSGPIREVFADLVAGTQPYRGLKRRLLATREWRLAVRAVPLVVQSRGRRNTWVG